MAKTKFYVVWRGYKPGIYLSWEDCNLQIKGFKGAQYKSYSSKGEAIAALKGPYGDAVQKKVSTLFDIEQLKLQGKPLPVLNSIAVDAACQTNPGPLEYKGVHTETGALMFQQETIPFGTNNIGEFLAIAQALKLLYNEKKEIPIYTDSKTAMAWIKHKRIKTTLERTPQTEDLWQRIDEAITWLETHSYTTPILKWKTTLWGEIPADYGRK